MSKRKESQNWIVLLIIVLLVLFLNKSMPRKELVGQTEFDYIYDNSHRDAMMFGSDYFLPKHLSFECANNYDRGYIYVKDTPPECWTTTITWHSNGQDTSFSMIAGETKQLNDYLQVTFNPEGHVYYGCYSTQDGEVCIAGDFKRPTHWSNRFTFRFISTDFIKVTPTDSRNELLLNSDSKIPLKIENAFAPNLKGGFVVKTINLGLHRENTYTLPIKFGIGTNSISLDGIPTDYIGYMNVELRPFITLNTVSGEITLIENTPLKLSYLITDTLSSPQNTCMDTTVVCASDGYYYRRCDLAGTDLTEASTCDDDMYITDEKPSIEPQESKPSKVWIYILGGAILIVALVLFSRKGGHNGE